MIDPELEKHGKEKGSAYLTFQTTTEDLDTNYLETSENHSVTNKEGSTALTTDPTPYITHMNKEQ